MATCSAGPTKRTRQPCRTITTKSAKERRTLRKIPQKSLNPTKNATNRCFGPPVSATRLAELVGERFAEVAAPLLVMPPCGEAAHAACSDCLHSWATSTHADPISVWTPQLPCIAGEACSAAWPSAEALGPVLRAEERAALRARYEAATRPLAETCYFCGVGNMALTPASRDRMPGTVEVRCDACGISACWHCLRTVEPGALDMIPCECAYDPTPTVFSWNRFFTVGGRMVRNMDLMPHRCIEQLRDMFRGDTIQQHCGGCGTPVAWAAQCHEMRHCHLKFCHVCGYRGLANETALVDHFSRGGACPRYDSYWREQEDIPYACEEGVCYTEGRPCRCEDHDIGRYWVEEYRRHRHVATAVASLAPIHRAAFVGIARADPVLHVYVEGAENNPLPN